MRISIIKALALEAIFLGAYFALRPYVGESEDMPLWLAYGLLAVVALDVWAVWFKLRAIRFELGEGDAVLPAHILVMAFLGVIRLAIFAMMASTAWEVIVGAQMAESSFNLLLVAIGCKELLVLGILVTAQKVGHPGRTGRSKPWMPVVFVADLVLAFSAEFVLLFLDLLFDGPALDTSWNPIFFIVMVILFGFLFLLFVLPFRILYSFESLKGSESAVNFEVGSVLLLLFAMIWGAVYSSANATENFTKALDGRPVATEFVYQRQTRLKTKTLSRLCELPTLSKLEMHCEYLGYLPPCVFAIDGLQDLNLAHNGLGRVELEDAKSLLRVNLRGNELAWLADLGRFDKDLPSAIEWLDLSDNSIRKIGQGLAGHPNLRWLDLSGNPLRSLSVPAGALGKLETLRLGDTWLSDAELAALQQRLPSTRIEL